MRNNLTGLLLSGLLHAGLIGWAVNASYIPPKEVKKQPVRELNISLFKAEKKKTPPPAPEQTAKKAPIKPQKEKKPANIIKAKAKAKTKDEPIVKAKPKPAKAIDKPMTVAVAKPAPIMHKVVKTKKKPVKKTRLKKIKLQKVAKRIVYKNKKQKQRKKTVHKKVQKRPIIKPAIQKTQRKPKKLIVAKRAPVRPARYKPAPNKKAVARKQPQKRNTYQPRKPIAAKRAPIKNNARVAEKKTPQAIRKIPARPAQYHKRTTRPVAPKVNTALVANLSKQYKARLRQIIITSKRYPKRAQRRNQQGKVTITFSVSHSGTIKDIKIIKSSGNSILDRASIKAIQQASRKLPYFKGMPKNSLKLTMTLSYVLEQR